MIRVPKIAGVTTCNPGSSVGETNIGLSVTGDSASLDLVNHSAGDYAINNPELDHRIVFYNGTSGLELHYENDANKMVDRMWVVLNLLTLPIQLQLVVVLLFVLKVMLLNPNLQQED